MFSQQHANIDWAEESARIQACTAVDVERALNKRGKRDLQDFRALISPAAMPYLEAMAQASYRATRQRFGNAMQLYVPLYVSNACTNVCTYCGFSRDNAIRRTILSPVEIDHEIAVIKGMGFDHVLLVTGEADQRVGFSYIRDCLQQLRPHFSNLSIEVQPLTRFEYQGLVDAGLNAVYVYQETYGSDAYARHHRAGKKQDLAWRLDCPDRLGEAGVHKVGLGVLIGLEDWRVDSLMCARHLRYLEQRYWRTRYSVSFPRLRPHAGGLELASVMNDADLVQLICAWRLFDEELELALSTRESEFFRDHVCRLGITSMSAASCTNPGGYSDTVDSLEQFEISDDRSALDIAAMLKRQGLEAVWKDWDAAYDVRSA